MAHRLVMGLFARPADAAAAARALRALGVPHERVSIVARSHDEEVDLARASGGSPGSELEDSPVASRLGELGAHLLAAVALVMPGIGPIVADGPLATGLGEAAGHLAGGLARTLEGAGLGEADADRIEKSVESGNLLVGGHVDDTREDEIAEALTQAGASDLFRTQWPDSQESARGV